MKLAQGSRWWILTSFICALIFLGIGLLSSDILLQMFSFISIVFFLLTAVFLIFFRDPDRSIGSGIVAVADGKIRSIEKIKDDYVGNSIFISTFMNINNVHVNRMPINGTIIKITHIKGSHLPAFTKESDRNERVIYEVKSSIGPVKIIQIAGTLARRIVPYVKKSQSIKKGEKLGIIRLGSRVDIYLPQKGVKNVSIKKGSKVKAGVDCLATIHD